MRKTTELKQLLRDRKLLLAPGAYDALSARIIETAGFGAVYMTGYGTSASVLGQPDVGLLTMSEMAERARNIAAAVKVPVVADGDTGFGNPLNVIRTVQAYERAGAAAIQLEDQLSPKRCGHMLGRQVIPMEEMVQKIRAAVEARQDDDFVVIARTDARTGLGLEEALRRGKAYEAAGADVIFIESPETVEEMAQIASAFPQTPTLTNMVEGGRTPILPAAELESLGFAIAIYPTGALYAAAKAVGRYLDELKRAGTPAGMAKDMIEFEAFNQLIGLPEYNRLEKRYAAK
jgi:carboxyvinyl-carboxyphosphonate phosphorylmutase